jgi:hypothetical protein
MSRISVLCLVLLLGCGGDEPEIVAVHGGLESTITLQVGETRPVPGTPLRPRSAALRRTHAVPWT